MKVWCIDPQGGGIPIPPNIQPMITAQANAYAEKQAWYPKFKLKIRYKGQFCYLEGYEEGEPSFPVGRLRYFGKNEWSLAFYTYSNERYEPCVFKNGKWFGTIEQAIDICAVYLI